MVAMKKIIQKPAGKEAVACPERSDVDERLRLLEREVKTLACWCRAERRAKLGNITEAADPGVAHPERLGVDGRLRLLEREVEKIDFWSKAEMEARLEHYAEDDKRSG